MAGEEASTASHFESRDYLERFSKLIARGRTILDAGCGDGLPVDAYLVEQGFAVNGIDASPQSIELAARNVPRAFYEVKDMLDLQEGEYCVNGVVSLRAMLDIPRGEYRALIERFASFMPAGGPVLLAMRPVEGGRAGEASGGNGNTEILVAAGFTISLSRIDGQGDQRKQIILARS